MKIYQHLEKKCGRSSYAERYKNEAFIIKQKIEMSTKGNVISDAPFFTFLFYAFYYNKKSS